MDRRARSGETIRTNWAERYEKVNGSVLMAFAEIIIKEPGG